MKKSEHAAAETLICKGKDEKLGLSFLMMEVIERGTYTDACMTEMGHMFAAMHLAESSVMIGAVKIVDYSGGDKPLLNGP